MQGGASLSWLIGGEDASVESLVSLVGGGQLCGAPLPSLPAPLTRAMVGGALGGRVYVCGGVAGAGDNGPKSNSVF